ncbi:MAG: nickel pincer cofactor biosynthesis protein LarB [Thermoplasmata archaeon]
MRVGDFACIDPSREERTGVPEVVLAEGKSVEQVASIARAMLERTGRAIVTRASPAVIRYLRKMTLRGGISGACEVHEAAQVVVLKRDGFKPPKKAGVVGVLSAGTSDFRVAEEARVIAQELGCRVVVAHDVGVAGVHRAFEALEKMRREGVDVYVVVAGREGALPTLVAGMVDAPVIGVPVSTGYGIARGGRSALYAMLQSCAPLVVVNIDAGFIAGAVASQIARVRGRGRGASGGGGRGSEIDSERRGRTSSARSGGRRDPRRFGKKEKKWVEEGGS